MILGTEGSDTDDRPTGHQEQSADGCDGAENADLGESEGVEASGEENDPGSPAEDGSRKEGLGGRSP